MQTVVEQLMYETKYFSKVTNILHKNNNYA